MLRLADKLDESGAYNRLIDQMSVRNLDLAGRSGHDQFFVSVRTFGPVSRLGIGEAVAEVATGDSAGAANPSRACAEFLASSERAQEQWRLEAEFVDFEKLHWVPLMETDGGQR